MSGLTLRLKAPATERINLSEITPAKLAALSSHAMARLNVGFDKGGLALGDAFDISGNAGDTLTIEGSGASLDFAGSGLDSGTIRIVGNAGAYAGRKMSGGKLEIRGNAGNFLASRATGGMIHVSGNAGDNLGGVIAGDRFGMQGGIAVIDGNVGDRAGEKMRRGTLIGPSVDRLLPTFVDCGKHDLVIVRVLSRYLKNVLGDLAPKPMPLFIQKIAGDMATIGRGEILLPAS